MNLAPDLSSHRAVYYIKPVNENLFSVQCLNDLPIHGFDVFGILNLEAADQDCSVLQRILEHMDQCTPGHRPKSSQFFANRKDPLNPIYKLVVEWM